MACLRGQVIFILISGHLFCHLSSALIQANHADVYKTICEDFASMCPCESNKLIVTEAGKPDSKSWSCGSSVTVKSLEKLPTIKVPPETKLVPVHPFVHFIYSGCEYVLMSYIRLMLHKRQDKQHLPRSAVANDPHHLG